MQEDGVKAELVGINGIYFSSGIFGLIWWFFAIHLRPIRLMIFMTILLRFFLKKILMIFWLLFENLYYNIFEQYFWLNWFVENTLDMISLLAIFFLFFLIFLIASATSRISFKMSDFLGNPSHLLIVWTSFGTEVFISSLFSATGRGPASVREFRAINAKQTENKTSVGYFKRLKKFIFWDLVHSWNHERKHIIIYRVQLIKHPILQIPNFNFPI